ncbi:agmatine deiminase family protein [Polluticoccus soli]|uniref:agmatine deiminase family protein n=1 Tax=Polluticoccus soli TaxID=3034150 RepID=UPI0023E1A671|nr:agmatine deiminase family protein [Flavipsychrobacter sp. JY13-12]
MRRFALVSALSILSLGAMAQQRWHIMPSQKEIDFRKMNPKPAATTAAKTTAVWELPAGARYPGEFEESQAVLLAWVYDYVPPYAVDVSSYYANAWGDMAAAIQDECSVWIRIEQGADSNTIKTFMANRGTPLTNYRFYVAAGDDFWIRDFGPLSFYHGSNDDLGFLDMNYYPGRANDDVYPDFLANQLGITNVRTSLYAEGGNYITDGLGTSFHSDRIHKINTVDNPWTLQQVKDTVKRVWASNAVVTTPELKCDGGTGHNDMFMKLMDEQTFAIMEYPNTVTATDYTTIQNVINQLIALKTPYNTAYRIFKLPMPTQDNGTTLKTCSSIDGDARTFVNGTTVNKTYIMPSYSDGSSGNQQGDQDAINIFKKNAPGYKVVPIDARGLTVLGGAIHCVNMQIPADNPIHFWHPPVIDLQPKQDNYHIVSKITNRSGIATAKCLWRMKGAASWNTINLTDSSGYWIGDISGTFNHPDVVEYYLTATSNNGKTMTKPITAPSGGYYTFYLKWAASVYELDKDRNFVLNPLPNPTTGVFDIPVSFETEMHLEAQITDVFGKKINAADFGTRERGMNKLKIDITELPTGMYFIQVIANGQVADTKRIVKQ